MSDDNSIGERLDWGTKPNALKMLGFMLQPKLRNGIVPNNLSPTKRLEFLIKEATILSFGQGLLLKFALQRTV